MDRKKQVDGNRPRDDPIADRQATTWEPEKVPCPKNETNDLTDRTLKNIHWGLFLKMFMCFFSAFNKSITRRWTRLLIISLWNLIFCVLCFFLCFFWFGWVFLMNTGPYTCCVESLDDGWLFGLVNRSLSVVGQCSQLAQRSLRTQEVQNKSSFFYPLFNSFKEFFFSFFFFGTCYKYEILFYFYTLCCYATFDFSP